MFSKKPESAPRAKGGASQLGEQSIAGVRRRVRWRRVAWFALVLMVIGVTTAVLIRPESSEVEVTGSELREEVDFALAVLDQAEPRVSGRLTTSTVAGVPESDRERNTGNESSDEAADSVDLEFRTIPNLVGLPVDQAITTAFEWGDLYKAEYGMEESIYRAAQYIFDCNTMASGILAQFPAGGTLTTDKFRPWDDVNWDPAVDPSYKKFVDEYGADSWLSFLPPTALTLVVGGAHCAPAPAFIGVPIFEAESLLVTEDLRRISFSAFCDWDRDSNEEELILSQSPDPGVVTGNMSVNCWSD